MPTQSMLTQTTSNAPKPLLDIQLSSSTGVRSASVLTPLPPPPPQQGEVSLPLNWKSAQDSAGTYDLQTACTHFVVVV